jgi:hypothetical protein
MPSLYIREVPPALYRKIKEHAEADRRSLQKEAVWLLEKSLTEGTSRLPEWGRMWSFRKTMRRYGVLSDSTPVIRRMRDGR